jgi:hypothetical protein
MRIVPVVPSGPRLNAWFGPSSQLAPVHPVGELALGPESVEVADDPARVAPDVVVPALHRVELFDDRVGDDDVVVLEDEQRVGVVQQHVRVEHEVLDPDPVIGVCVGRTGPGGGWCHVSAGGRGVFSSTDSGSSIPSPVEPGCVASLFEISSTRRRAPPALPGAMRIVHTGSPATRRRSRATPDESCASADLSASFADLRLERSALRCRRAP